MLFFLICIHQRIQKSITISTISVSNINDIKNVNWAANQHIRMVSERSCDTENWSKDC